MGSDDGKIRIAPGSKGLDYRSIQVLAVTQERGSRLANQIEELIQSGFLLEQPTEDGSKCLELRDFNRFVPRWRVKRDPTRRKSGTNSAKGDQRSREVGSSPVLYSSLKRTKNREGAVIDGAPSPVMTETTQKTIRNLFAKRGIPLPAELGKGGEE
jgi:hypothetical protein